MQADGTLAACRLQEESSEEWCSVKETGTRLRAGCIALFLLFVARLDLLVGAFFCAFFANSGLVGADLDAVHGLLG